MTEKDQKMNLRQQFEAFLALTRPSYLSVVKTDEFTKDNNDYWVALALQRLGGLASAW